MLNPAGWWAVQGSNL